MQPVPSLPFESDLVRPVAPPLHPPTRAPGWSLPCFPPGNALPVDLDPVALDAGALYNRPLRCGEPLCVPVLSPLASWWSAAVRPCRRRTGPGRKLDRW